MYSLRLINGRHRKLYEELVINSSDYFNVYFIRPETNELTIVLQRFWQGQIYYQHMTGTKDTYALRHWSL